MTILAFQHDNIISIPMTGKKKKTLTTKRISLYETKMTNPFYTENIQWKLTASDRHFVFSYESLCRL